MAAKRYVQFMYSGIRHKYYYEEEIAHRNDPKKVEIPEENSIIGFRFLKRPVMNINGHEIKGKKFDVTAWYYIGTQKSTNAVIARNGEEILLAKHDQVIEVTTEPS